MVQRIKIKITFKLCYYSDSELKTGAETVPETSHVSQMMSVLIVVFIWTLSGSECTVYRVLARDVGYGAGLSGSNISAEARMQILRIHARETYNC